MYVGFTFVSSDMSMFPLLLSTVLKPWVWFWVAMDTHILLWLFLELWIFTPETSGWQNPDHLQTMQKTHQSPDHPPPPKNPPNPRKQVKISAYSSARPLVFLPHHTTTTYFLLKGNNQTEMKSRKVNRHLEELLLYKTHQSVQLLVNITTNPLVWFLTNPRFG